MGSQDHLEQGRIQLELVSQSYPCFFPDISAILLFKIPVHSSLLSSMGDFKASQVAFEVQKHFANKFFSNKVTVKGLIDESTGNLVDNLYNLLFAFTNNKKDSENTTRNMIKMSVKIAMLQRGEKFNTEEKELLMMIHRHLHTVAMTLVTFYQVDHTFDKVFLIKYFTELENMLKTLVRLHLTEKSVTRVEQIFEVLKTAEFLECVFVPGKNTDMRNLMERVVDDLNSCMEAGVL